MSHLLKAPSPMYVRLLGRGGMVVTDEQLWKAKRPMCVRLVGKGGMVVTE